MYIYARMRAVNHPVTTVTAAAEEEEDAYKEVQLISC